MRENGTETLEGKSEIGSSNEITLPDERTYTSADVTKVSTNNGTTYTYEQSKDAYGTVNPDGSYTPDGSKTSVIVTEDGSQIIILRYYQNQTQTQTARQLGMTQVQVSRLERRALDRLKKELT